MAKCSLKLSSLFHTLLLRSFSARRFASSFRDAFCTAKAAFSPSVKSCKQDRTTETNAQIHAHGQSAIGCHSESQRNQDKEEATATLP
jgi:hypothetical protein